MAQMHVSHDPVVVAQTGHAHILRGTDIEGAEFADGVVIADFQPGRLTGVFLVLRNGTQRAELENAVVLADAGMPFNHHVRTYPGTAVDGYIRANDGIGANFHISGNVCLGVDNRCRMNGHAQTSRLAHMISASQAT